MAMLWVMSGSRLGKVLANYVLGRLEGQRSFAKCVCTAADCFGVARGQKAASPAANILGLTLQVIAQLCADKLAWLNT